jgi:hypothetical protein
MDDMTETPTAPQGAPQGEPVAPPVTPVAATGTETPATPTDPAEQPSGDASKPQPWFMKRINQQSAKIAAQAREIEAQKALLAAKPAEPQAAEPTQPIPGMVPASEVDRLANQRSEQREFERKVTEWDAAGRKEFPDFVDRCNAVANMGASERPEFMRIVADIPDGHKIVAQLADNPDEAVRILNLPAHRMAYELAKFTPKPKPVSAAPEPIKPISGPAGGAPNALSDDAKVDAWMKARQAQVDEKRRR